MGLRLFNDYKTIKEHIDSKYYSKYFLFPFLINKSLASLHYVLYGYKKRYNPSDNFNTHYYLNKYPDIKNAEINPFVHYITFGIKEKRSVWFESEIDYFDMAQKFTFKSSLFSKKTWKLFAKEEINIDLFGKYFDHIEYKRHIRIGKFIFFKTLLGVHYLIKGHEKKITPSIIYRPNEVNTDYTFFDIINGLSSKKHIGISLQNNYNIWISKNENLSKETALSIIDNFTYKPLISIIIPVYNANVEYLKQAIYSVKNQYYKNWEICIADDCSTSNELKSYLEKIEQEENIKIKFRDGNGHISACSNTALKLANGEFIALLDQDDLLSKNALLEIVKKLNKNKSYDLIFSNEDKIDENNRRFNPYFKKGWNYHLLLSQNYVSHLGVYRKTIIDKIDGFRLGYEGSQDYDLLLRFLENTNENNIAYINEVLYHWRAIEGSTALNVGEKSYAVNAGIKSLQDHLDRTGQAAEAIPSVLPQFYRVKRKLTTEPLVSIIIPTRNYVSDLIVAVNSVLHKNKYQNFEIIIVDNDSDDSEALEYFNKISENEKVNVLHFSGEFNFSAINNYAVKESKGELILFLNNDIEAINDIWLEELVSQILLDEVAITGAKLLYPDDTIQHAGVEIGLGGVAGHIYNGSHKDAPGDFGKTQLIQNYDAVTAACLLIKKKDFNTVGGFDEKNLKVAFNDVDLCLKIRGKNKKIVYCPDAVLYHYESKSRGNDMDKDKIERFNSEIEYMISHWNIK